MIGLQELKLLDEMVTSVMAGPSHSSAFLAQAQAFVGTDERTARGQVASLGRLLTGQRWWQSQLEREDAPIEPPSTLSVDKKLEWLEQKFSVGAVGVAADVTACEPYRDRLRHMALADDAPAAFFRIAESLLGDLALACKMSAAARALPEDEAKQVLAFLVEMSGAFKAGESLVSSLADRINSEDV